MPAPCARTGVTGPLAASALPVITNAAIRTAAIVAVKLVLAARASGWMVMNSPF
jgi:hypothetical protein